MIKGGGRGVALLSSGGDGTCGIVLQVLGCGHR